jgi:hypothetical protein
MLTGKRRGEWIIAAHLMSASISPHAGKDSGKYSPLKLMPKDLLPAGSAKRGRTKSDVQAMRGVFANVVSYKAAEVRVVRED